VISSISRKAVTTRQHLMGSNQHFFYTIKPVFMKKDKGSAFIAPKQAMHLLGKSLRATQHGFQQLRMVEDMLPRANVNIRSFCKFFKRDIDEVYDSLYPPPR
jgi:hypothetical protein